jgi:hypothetical protein
MAADGWSYGGGSTCRNPMIRRRGDENGLLDGLLDGAVEARGRRCGDPGGVRRRPGVTALPSLRDTETVAARPGCECVCGGWWAICLRALAIEALDSCICWCWRSASGTDSQLGTCMKCPSELSERAKAEEAVGGNGDTGAGDGVRFRVKSRERNPRLGEGEADGCARIGTWCTAYISPLAGAVGGGRRCSRATTFGGGVFLSSDRHSGHDWFTCPRFCSASNQNLMQDLWNVCLWLGSRAMIGARGQGGHDHGGAKYVRIDSTTKGTQSCVVPCDSCVEREAGGEVGGRGKRWGLHDGSEEKGMLEVANLFHLLTYSHLSSFSCGEVR